ncbi:serine/threonine-protein kinase HT1-like protein [Tanacetum coccineum]
MTEGLDNRDNRRFVDVINEGNKKSEEKANYNNATGKVSHKDFDVGKDWLWVQTGKKELLGWRRRYQQRVDSKECGREKMDSKNEETKLKPKAEVSESELKGMGSVRENHMLGDSSMSASTKDMLFRADKIDLKSLDVHLEKHMSRVWSRNTEPNRPKEPWEIDLAKLEIRNLIARGTYGTVYRGTYDEQDVAVKLLDWGEDDMATTTELAALRASFRQEVAVWHKLDHPNVTRFVGASMGTSNLRMPEKTSSGNLTDQLPAKACCVVVEFLTGGTLKGLLFKNRRKKLPFKAVIQLALDLSRGTVKNELPPLKEDCTS